MFCKITFHNQKIQFSPLAWNLAQIALSFQQLALHLPHAPMWKSVDSQTCKQILINFTYYFVLLLVNQCIIALSECVLPSARAQQSLPMQWGKLKISFFVIKFIYSEKATKFCKISTLLLSVCSVDKSKVEISQNFVAFSEYTNFNVLIVQIWLYLKRLLPCQCKLEQFLILCNSYIHR